MFSNTLVSTIIPVFNRPAMLRAAVASVLAQSHRPIEVIVVDDGSTDGMTPGVAAEIAARHPDVVRTCRIPNGGPGAARQAGLEIAKGAFIQFLDSDDLLEPDKFERQCAALAAQPHCAIAYGKTRRHRIGEPPVDVPWKRTGERIRTMFPGFLESRWWGTSTPLYRRAILDAAGAWTRLRNEEDWEYDCRIAAQGVELAYCDAFVSTQRVHDGSHLSEAGGRDPDKLKDRAEAHRLVFRHARDAGVSVEAPEMKHFARELFLLSRQCGAAGLPEQSRMLFHLSREASTPSRGRGMDYRIYAAGARLVGWQLAGRGAAAFDRIRKARKSEARG